ncbi:MAG: hypothetical protein Q9161_008009 [Pseudevernia consocians]
MDDEDEFWSLRSQDLNRLFAGHDPEPFSDANCVLGVPGGSFHDQLGAEQMQQISWGNQDSASTFDWANLQAQTTNNVTSGEQSIYNPGQPVIHNPTQPFAYNPFMYNPNVPASDQDDQLLQPAMNHEMSYQTPANDTEGLRGSRKRATQSQPSGKKQKRSALRPSPSESSSAATAHVAAEGNMLSKLGQKRAALQGRMGNDNREKAPIRRVDGVLYGLVDGKWEKAGYHCDFREKLILLDAQQPGAPVFRTGMSNNYTSYSRVTRDWSANPASVRDRKGRQVHFLATRPADLPADPNCGYLMCEGLFMLDRNDRVIKAYPGAPRTLSTDLPGWMSESLKRVFGMTYPDQLARMSAVYKLKRGKTRPLFGTTSLSNRTRAFRKTHKDLGMVPWDDREKGKATKSKGS